jgi:hypothetical protein
MNRRYEVDVDLNYIGRRELQALQFGTLHALERAGLADLVQHVRERVFARDSAELCDVVKTDVDCWQVTYKPMIELLLHEIRHVARALHTSEEDRRMRIEWAMTMAGV